MFETRSTTSSGYARSRRPWRHLYWVLLTFNYNMYSITDSNLPVSYSVVSHFLKLDVVSDRGTNLDSRYGNQFLYCRYTVA